MVHLLFFFFLFWNTLFSRSRTHYFLSQDQWLCGWKQVLNQIPRARLQTLTPSQHSRSQLLLNSRSSPSLCTCIFVYLLRMKMFLFFENRMQFHNEFLKWVSQQLWQKMCCTWYWSNYCCRLGKIRQQHKQFMCIIRLLMKVLR